jgi:putative membrane protein
MTAVVAVLHIYFLVLEMILWTKPFGRKVFRLSEVKAEETKVLAANQGLYNGFLAAGLVWSLVYPSMFFARELGLFFLACVIVAGIYGAYSVNRKIFFVQALPAIIAFVATYFVNP